jgi:4a-hydroxytetrahydrobiopterin dehydratase
MASVLSSVEIQSRVKQLPSDWSLQGQRLVCLKKFAGFVEAIAFVNQLVEPAEAAGHHPDLEISYNKVTIYLTTHDAGGLTEKDFALAAVIARL